MQPAPVVVVIGPLGVQFVERIVLLFDPRVVFQVVDALFALIGQLIDKVGLDALEDPGVIDHRIQRLVGAAANR